MGICRVRCIHFVEVELRTITIRSEVVKIEERSTELITVRHCAMLRS